MLLVLITVGSLATALGLGIAYNKQKSNLADAVAKYEAIKKFADEAAQKILSLEEKNLSLANNLLDAGNQIIALKTDKQRSQEVIKTPLTDQPANKSTKPNRNKFRGKKNTNKVN